MQLKLSDYDYRRVNNFVLQRGEIEAIFQRMLPLTPAQRLQLTGLEPGREDLIVAGTHGRKGFSKFFLGSVAERVLTSAPCPVVTVKSA